MSTEKCELIIDLVTSDKNLTLYDMLVDLRQYVNFKNGDELSLLKIKTLIHPDKIKSNIFNALIGNLPRGKIQYKDGTFNVSRIITNELKNIPNDDTLKTLVNNNKNALCTILKDFDLGGSSKSESKKSEQQPQRPTKQFSDFKTNDDTDYTTIWFWQTVASLGLVGALLALKRIAPHMRFRRQRIRIHTVNDKGRELFIDRRLHQKIMERIARLLGIDIDDLEIETAPTYEDIIFMVPRGINNEVLFKKVADEIEKMGVLQGAELRDNGHVWLFALKK